MENQEKAKLIMWGAKLTNENISFINKIKEDGDFKTFNELFDSILERYYNPIRINNENQRKIDEQEQAIAELKKLNAQLTEKIEHNALAEQELQQKYEIEIAGHKKTIAELINNVQDLHNFIEETTEKTKLPADHYIIRIDSLNYKILKYVADRETKQRKQQWSLDDVINYFIHFRFEKGALNGDLNSVPDIDIRKMKNE